MEKGPSLANCIGVLSYEDEHQNRYSSNAFLVANDLIIAAANTICDQDGKTRFRGHCLRIQGESIKVVSKRFPK